MPTYTVTTSNVNLNSKKQRELAKGITKIHNVVTGANTYSVSYTHLTLPTICSV